MFPDSPEEDTSLDLKNLLRSGNTRRMVTFTGEFHKHDKITNYKKVFDSAILYPLIFLMFMPVL